MEEKILNHLRRYFALRDNRQRQNTSISEELRQNASNLNTKQISKNEEFLHLTNSHEEIEKVYENDSIQLFVRRAYHRRLKNFKLQDIVYHVSVKVKQETSKTPLLIDLLDTLEKVIFYVLKEIQSFYTSSDHNEVYLSLLQEPLINSLNCNSVDLSDDNQLREATLRILDMLYRYLISDNHIDLKINDSLKIYAHVLSVDHTKYNLHQKKRPNPKKKKEETRLWLSNKQI